ncbi:chemotaxis protein CheA [Malikia granosa]|uniref:Chemotaxis protein CheA n=1 Tax=Malikia granosa TaxID=263067 RepID=A0A2S9K4G5_9BURK|nr:chemotaxis protein CheA [Malikia granosa]PRD65284.1 chemotaxis protein CheA [Malikia granosa]
MIDDMLQEFVVEALELAAQVEDNLLALELQPDSHEILNAVFRAFHTIKGSAGFMNLPSVVAACHLTENLFDALRTGAAPVTQQAIDVALEASGFVADQLAALAEGVNPEQLPAMPAALEDRLTAVMAGIGEDKAAATEPAPVASEPAPVQQPQAAAPGPQNLPGQIDWQAYYEALLPASALGAAASIASELDDFGTPPEEEPALPAIEPERRAAQADRRELPDRREAAEAQPAPDGQQQVSAKEESLRVRADKLDALLEVAGESVQAANQAGALFEKLMLFKQEDEAMLLMSALAETLQRAARYTSELQRATLATRMQPVGRLFQRFPRLVRDLSRDLGKQVELVIEGAETEVDRIVVDSLYDPLVHMLRNSLDHGVEPAEKRLAAGKPEKARISLRAWQEAGNVVIEVADDGAGMDPERLRHKAKTLGLIGEHLVVSDEDALQLAFLPGLSTKAQASSVSGRGVGMDVVKTTVEKHRGTIHIESTLGQGTCFSIRLPIELSIVPTMLVSAGEVLVGMPMSAVERVIELPEELMSVSGQPVFRDQGRTLPVRSLASVLGYTPREERIGIVVASPKPYILGVCLVEGTADLVIKPLTAMPARGIAGTARSAEGSLVLILDVAFLLAGGR